jgi:hypothetical protein
VTRRGIRIRENINAYQGWDGHRPNWIWMVITGNFTSLNEESDSLKWTCSCDTQNVNKKEAYTTATESP